MRAQTYVLWKIGVTWGSAREGLVGRGLYSILTRYTCVWTLTRSLSAKKKL